MASLSGKEAGNAWEDYRAYLEDCGILESHANIGRDNFNKENMKLQMAKMAFKQGFVAGVAEAMKPVDHTPLVIIDDEKEKKVITRKVRSLIQRKEDNELLETLLRENVDPMPLREIIEKMKANGRNHWDVNNGSGFIKTAMQDGYRVKKADYGVYSFSRG